MLLPEILDGCYIDISSQTYGELYSKDSIGLLVCYDDSYYILSNSSNLNGSPCYDKRASKYKYSWCIAEDREDLENAIDQMGIKFILKDIDSVKIGEL